MAIELYLNRRSAKALLKALKEPSITNKAIAEIYETLAVQIEEADEEFANLPPWRKVVGFEMRHHTGVETLECGHKYFLRYSSKAGSGWMEDQAKRRRCKQCSQSVAAKKDIRKAIGIYK